MTATEDNVDQISSSFQDLNVGGCSPSKSPFLLQFPNDIARENQYDEVHMNHRCKPLLISRRVNKQNNPSYIFPNSSVVPPPPPPMSADGAMVSSTMNTARSSPPKQFMQDEIDDEANLSFNEESYITPVMQTNRKMYTGPTRTPHLPCLSELNRHNDTNERREGRNDFNLSEMREAVRAAESAVVSAPRLMLRRANRVKSSRPDLVGL
mmetsp:Transcript_16138/g.25163  ORF Transcript_16138/g.25163 Transcript_16138/m.25163 type:complete len:209 (+) Transcript_16138:98-724(+)|eukprot:CAMPEP_0196808346 /NCGR_PEP_ID=MMETSP1362-20130617/8334_1 /TAXON_ID=163516 /ORGANISM="Leptocylindrus danicus, Strain CCMP1856" /LENGTH=208 /DNA_ID=CAMNT_0042182645 /DNA_START=87 /DNA_END=716 /DNA_ORIENTATION=+